MRQITHDDVANIFLAFTGDEAIETVHPEHQMAIAAMLTDMDALERMGLGEDDVIRVGVMVFGAFTAGVLTAQRLIEE